MWSMRKLSLFQMLSGTWKVNDHLPQQDWAPGLWAPASPTAWRAEPSGEGPRNAQCRGGAQGWSCWQSWCLGATAPVSILPAPQKAKPPTLQLFIGLRDHTIPEHTPRQSCSIGWFLKREESLQAKATMTLLQRTDRSIFTHFFWGYTKVCEHISVSHWELTERLQVMRETSFFFFP